MRSIAKYLTAQLRVHFLKCIATVVKTVVFSKVMVILMYVEVV